VAGELVLQVEIRQAALALGVQAVEGVFEGDVAVGGESATVAFGRRVCIRKSFEKVNENLFCS